MKIPSALIAFAMVVSVPVAAAPYAEWGVLADGTSLKEVFVEVKMPEASEVPLPPPPGGVFINSAFGSGSCIVGMRTKHTVDEVCDFYRAKLKSPEYLSVKEAEMEGVPSCAIYKNGNADHQAVGVLVYENEDQMMAKNGTTLTLLSYKSPVDDDCDGLLLK
ncbi:hypothetical protein [Marinobacter sp. NFXS9]|uniref:hypothetical protein n=1 Tax=Marinobacter sp. NFXS9 TaxID=2818433 RepID=UPI0032DE99C5